jgi:hypothetical protein
VRLSGLISLPNRYDRLSDKVDHPFSVPCQRTEETGHISAPIYLIVGYTLANDWIASISELYMVAQTKYNPSQLVI